MGLERRQRENEWMDEPGVDPDLLARSLGYIRAVNRWFGYTRATLSHFERFAAGWERGKIVRVLDVATGSGDVPAALIGWGRRRGFDVRVLGVDLHEKTIREAAGQVRDNRVAFARGDALRLPFADGAFDYAMCSMFLHHLDDEVVVRVLREMNRVSRGGLVAADLIRDRRALMWIRLFSLTANPIVRHDAAVSVRQAFRRDEIVDLARRAGLDYVRYFTHFAYRFVLAGEKGA
jgi:ubiquinone/menaquinone biosynthesis C-methylase UbiE